MASPLTRQNHVLKCWPEFFGAIVSGKKKFEIRPNDRNFNVGDTLELREFIPCPVCRGKGEGWDFGRQVKCTACDEHHGKYTMAVCHCEVDYVLREGFGLQDGYVCMSIQAEPSNTRRDWTLSAQVVTGIDGSVVRTGSLDIFDATWSEARRTARCIVEETWPEYDPRIQPSIIIVDMIDKGRTS